MEISVLGCGRWGSFIAWYLCRVGHSIRLYGRETSPHMQSFLRTRSNGLLTLQPEIRLLSSLEEAARADVLVISVAAQSLRGLMEQVSSLQLCGKLFVLCMKGIEGESCKRLSEVAKEYAGNHNKIAVWLGPGHVQEFLNGTPNCMVIDSEEEDIKRMLISAFSSDLIRFYIGQDLLGNEIGAAAKNVVGVASGMLDGMGLSSLKGALCARGPREIARLIAAMGGNELSAYGLCHLGDYGATVFSPYSHNRLYGEAFAQGKASAPDHLAEGVHTVTPLVRLGQTYGVELPICNAVWQALYKELPIGEAIDSLFARSLKNEF